MLACGFTSVGAMSYIFWGLGQNYEFPIRSCEKTLNKREEDE